MCSAYRHASHLARDLARPTSYQSRLVGRLGASERAAVLAQPVRSKTFTYNAAAPKGPAFCFLSCCSTSRDLRYALAEADADSSFKSTMQTRDADWVALSNGRGQVARSPTVKEVKPLDLSYLSDLASSYPPRLPLDCCAVADRGGRDKSHGFFRVYRTALRRRVG